MTEPDNALRAMLAQRIARSRHLMERITDHADAKAMLADAMSREDNQQEGTEHDG